jgi:predicted chitinase
MRMVRHRNVSPSGELWKWLAEAGENFPRELRGPITGTPPIDPDDGSSNIAQGAYVPIISAVVKKTFGYNERTEWKDDVPTNAYRKTIFKASKVLKLTQRWSEFSRRVTSTKDKLLSFAGDYGTREAMIKEGLLSREQEEYDDGVGGIKKRMKIDSFDWSENTDRLDTDIVASTHADPESRAEQKYAREMSAYNKQKEKYDELIAAGVPPGATPPVAPVEPTKPAHMRARGGIIPSDNRHFNKGGEKQSEGFWTTRGAGNAKERAGHVVGAGTGTSDEIPSYLSSGEYVVRAKAVRRPGVMSLLRYINSLDDADGGGILGSSGVGEQDNFALNESIMAGTTKLETQLITANEKLQKLVDKPYIAVNFGDLTGPDLEKFKEMFAQMRTGGMSFADEAALRGKDAISKGVSWAWDKATWGAKKSWSLSTGTVKGAWGVAKKGYAGGKKILNDWFEDARDILVKGSTEVKIRAEDIRNRVLKDVNTGKVIEKLKDITGEVRRVDTDEIVLRIEDFKRGLTDDKFKPALEWVSKKFTQAKNLALMPFRAIRTTFNHIMQIIDMPDDIYVKGDTPWEPRMRVHLFRAGKYSDAKTGKTILIVSDIRGAVMQDMGMERQPIMVITDDEFNEGKLVGKDGEPIKGLRDKLYNGIKKAGRMVGELAKKGLGMVKDMGAWIWEKLGLGWDGIKSWFDGTGNIQLGIFTTQTATVTRLEQIWMLLNNRLPGDKEIKPEDFGKMAALRIPNLSGHLQSTEEWFQKKRANAELKAMIAREKLNNKIALMEAKRQDKAAALRARYEEKGEKVPFWVRMFGANKQQFKDEIKDIGKAAVDGAKKAKAGIDKPMTWDQYLNWAEKKCESKGVPFDRDNEILMGALKKEHTRYLLEFDKKTKMQKITSNAWSLGGMAKNIATKWGKGQAAGIREAVSDAVEDIRPMEFSEWLDKEWSMSMDEFNALPMHASDSSHSKNSLRDAWADYHHKFTMRLAKGRAAKDALAAKAGSLKDSAKGLLSGNKDFVGPMKPLSAKVSDFFGSKSANLRDYLEKTKPLTFEEWLAQTPTGLATYASLGNSDKAELEEQYKSYCIKFEKDREAQLGAMRAKTVKSISNLYDFFTKNKEITIDQYMDDIGVGASEYHRLKALGDEKATALKADYDAYMTGDVAAIARYNRLAAIQKAKNLVTKTQALKDKAVAARAKLKSIWTDRSGHLTSAKSKAQGMVSGIKSGFGKLFGKGKPTYMSFAEWLKQYGIESYDMDHISPDDKQTLAHNYNNYVMSVTTKQEELAAAIESEKAGTNTASTDDAKLPFKAKLRNAMDGAKGWFSAMSETGFKKFLRENNISYDNATPDEKKSMVSAYHEWKKKQKSDKRAAQKALSDARREAENAMGLSTAEQLKGRLSDKMSGLKNGIQGLFSRKDSPEESPESAPPAPAPKRSFMDRMRGVKDKAKGLFGKKRGAADLDGDGDRDGSAEDQRQQRDAAEEKGMMKKFFAGLGNSAKSGFEAGRGDGGIGIIKSMMGLVPKLFSGIAGGLGLVFQAAKGLLTLNVGKIAKAIAKPLAGAARMAMGTGGMLLRGGMAAMGWGAAILTSPVTLAVGATALAAYAGYSWLSNKMKNNDVLFRFRMLQYGFKHDDQDNVSKIIQTEKMLQGIVKFESDGLATLSQGIKAETLMAIWGIDTTDSKEVERWIVWFSGRFKPIYLSHCTAAKTLAKTVDLTKIDNMNTDDSLKYIKAVHYAGGGQRPYDIMASPVAGGDDLDVSGDAWLSHSVDNEYDDAVEWLKDNREEVDLENQAQTDPKKAKELQDLKDNKWQEKTKRAWETTKNAVSDGLDGAKKWLWDKPIEGWSMIGSGAAKVATGVGTLIRETAAKTVDAAGNTVNALRGIDAKKMRAMFISKMIKAGIVDPNEQALLLANVHSETGGFTRIGDEDLRYSVKRLKELRPDIKKLRNASDAEIEAAVAGGREKIAELMYGGRGGNTAAGEGFKYRGRGMLQLTFKGNYAQLSKAVKQDLVNNPDLVANDPNVAADTAIQYWLKRVDRKAAQRGDVDRVALQVNGGKIGITERHKNFAMYQKLITDGGLKQLDYDGQIGSAALANDAAKNVTSAGKPAPIPEPKTTASANTPDAKVASTGAAAPKAAASAAVDKPKAVVSGAAAPSDSGEAVVKSTQPNTAKVAAAAVAAPPATKAVDDAGGESTYVPTSPSNNAASVMPVSTAADPSTRRVVSDESVIPVDIMAQKAKEQQEAAAMMAEKRRQDALDTTSTGMDAAVMLMKEQLRVMTSMDTNLAKIERHMAAMAKSAGTPQAPAQQRQTPSAPPNLKLVQNNPTVEPTQPPVSVSRNS